MAEIGNTSVFSQTDANNNSGTVPTWAEGMAPSQVNDSARALQGAVTREWNWRNHTLTSGGSANTQTLTYSVAPAAYYNGQRFAFIAGFTNTGSATLNVNSVGAVTIKKMVAGVQTALAAGDITAGNFYEVAYNTSGTAFIVVGSAPISGVAVSATTLAASSTFTLSSVISPAQITGDQNDYAPTGHATAVTFRLSSDAFRTITGLAGGVAGRKVEIHNVGSQELFLADSSGSSTAANQFATVTAGGTYLSAGGIAYLTYDGTTSKWRVLQGVAIGANQTAMEAAANDFRPVTPLGAHFHPSASKCWGEFNGNSTTVLASYNITSVADTATGAMTVTIANDFSSVNWACFVSRAEDDITLVYSATYDAKAAGTVILRSAVEAGSGSDPSAASGNASWSFLGLGDL